MEKNHPVHLRLRVLLALTACALLAPACARRVGIPGTGPQAAKPAVTVLFANPRLLEGGWKTGPKNKSTTITATKLSDAVTFRFRCVELVGGKLAKFRFIVDKKAIIAPMTEGSSVLIRGKEIWVEQVGTNTFAFTTWQAVQSDPQEFDVGTWQTLGKGASVLAAALDKDQWFVLSFNLPGGGGCTDGGMVVTIDGKAVKNRAGDAALTFLPGSSLIGKGKIVSVRIAGKCPTGKRLTGTIKVAKVAP